MQSTSIFQIPHFETRTLVKVILSWFAIA